MILFSSVPGLEAEKSLSLTKSCREGNGVFILEGILSADQLHLHLSLSFLKTYPHRLQCI